MLRLLCGGIALLVALLLGPRTDVEAASTAAWGEHGYFYSGVRYAEVPEGGHVVNGQMWVEYFFPKVVRHPYPIVLITGGGPTGAVYEGTPDGRPGWADYYVNHGWKVYVTDQPARGRSALYPDLVGKTVRATAEGDMRRLSLTEKYQLWPQAKYHTQWPGSGPKKGMPGDPIFDQFEAGRVPFLADSATMERLNRQAVADLLDRIGPAIIETHSQSGAYGWSIADARPKLVKGILAVEPSGPPFHEVHFIGPPKYFGKETVGRPWGVTNNHITYSPPVHDPSELHFVQQKSPDRPDLARCWMQAAPARTLPTLQHAKILVLTSQASYHAAYDNCTVKYLRQAGVHLDWIRLVDRGIYGNSHEMMIEKNNMAIVAVMGDWLTSQGL